MEDTATTRPRNEAQARFWAAKQELLACPDPLAELANLVARTTGQATR